VTDLNEVFCFVFAVSLIILESEAAEGAVVSFHLVVGTGVRLDLHKIMLEDRANSIILPKKGKKGAKTAETAPRPKILGTLIGGSISPADAIPVPRHSGSHDTV
jgi:hypothetical protein